MAEIIINPSGSIILAEGHGRNFWFSWKAIALGILIGLLVLLGALMIGLARNLPIPQETVFVAILTSKDAKQLPEPLRRALPTDVRDLLDAPSRWPTLFGVYRREEGWYTFIASPIWHAPKTDKPYVTRAGLVTFASDTETAPTWGKSYLGFLERHRIGGMLAAADVERFFGSTTTNPRSWTWFRTDGTLIRSDRAFPGSEASSIPAADVAMRLEPADGKDALAASIPDLPDVERLKRLPPMTEVAVKFGERGPSLVRLSFDRALNENDASILLGAYGFTARKTVILPDGTLSYERIEPVATSGTSLIGERTDERGRIASISGTTFALHDASTTGDLPSAPVCAEGSPWVRLSEHALASLTKRFGLPLEEKDLRPVQLVSVKGKLAICFE